MSSIGVNVTYFKVELRGTTKQSHQAQVSNLPLGLLLGLAWGFVRMSFSFLYFLLVLVVLPLVLVVKGENGLLLVCLTNC